MIEIVNLEPELDDDKLCVVREVENIKKTGNRNYVVFIVANSFDNMAQVEINMGCHGIEALKKYAHTALDLIITDDEAKAVLHNIY